MPADPEDLRELLIKIRYDATAIQAKVTDALLQLARLDVAPPPAPFVCPECGVEKRTEAMLLDHLANVHDVQAEAA